MKIVYPLNDIFYSAFPNLKEATSDVIINVLSDYYSLGDIRPRITINDDCITVDIDIPKIEQGLKYRNAVEYCEKGNFSEAKKILEQLIIEDSTNSEYYRLIGQIASEEGNQEDAIDYLIDAIRWNPQNKWAYLMLGNIFIKYKKDDETGLKYYNQVLLIDDKDFITLNNIAVSLAQMEKFDESEKYFLKSLEINPEYINSYIGIVKVKTIRKDFKGGAEIITKGLKLSNPKDKLYSLLIDSYLELAKESIDRRTVDNIVISAKSYIEKEYHRNIELREDNNINTLAKLEIAENYNREQDLVLYKSAESVITPHLIMHELCHLILVSQARQSDVNKLFTSDNQLKETFVKKIASSFRNLKAQGYPSDAIDKLSSMLFDGLNLQVYNAPIDLFIEDYLYNQHPDLRANQLISLHKIVKDGIYAVTRKDIIDMMPSDIISKSKIYNLVQGLQLKSLFGIDLISEYNASKSELSQAQKFWEEYLEYKEETQAGEEYELVQNWAEDLNLDGLFRLIDEKSYIPQKTAESFLDGIVERQKQRQLESFYEEQKEKGINTEVIDYMVESIKYFKNKSIEDIRTTAFEIATVGMNGISPEKNGYKIKSMPNKEFSGYEFLAYYYVSFKLSCPEVMGELGLPFDIEYDSAQDVIKLGLK